MEKLNMNSYFLVHITTLENYNSIIKMNQFLPSKYTLKNPQWLGNGVYLWPDNDLIKLGKSLVKCNKKVTNKDLKRIYIQVDIDENKHVNLDTDYWQERFLKFTNNIYNEDNTLLNILAANREYDKPSSACLGEFGKEFGKCVDLFIKYLKSKGFDIDIVSYYFYHGRRNNVLGRKELYFRQFCIKNENLVNDLNSCLI